MGIIHRDLKPENILLNSKTSGVYDVRIADFGFAIREDSKEVAENIICGTPGYIAPEILSGSGHYSKKSDVFSLGSILYNILSLKNLFPGANHRDVLVKNKDCNLSHIDQYLLLNSPLVRNLVA
jgi:serine/threonine protein kinase